ncbi:hypothetical protein IKQ19_07480 [Candidatus Saccharibacteria bacterium]|nr:hypothetical protein [Candidatus Saccharibacteria bacterium]
MSRQTYRAASQNYDVALSATGIRNARTLSARSLLKLFLLPRSKIPRKDGQRKHLAGHTHTAIKREYIDKLGKRHLLLCNPVGYPDENPFAEYGLKREDFLVEVE